MNVELVNLGKAPRWWKPVETHVTELNNWEDKAKEAAYRIATECGYEIPARFGICFRELANPRPYAEAEFAEVKLYIL